MSDAKYTDALKDAHAAQRITQAEAVATMAALLGSYYLALVKEGIPDDLARDLVIDFHVAQLDKIHG